MEALSGTLAKGCGKVQPEETTCSRSLLTNLWRDHHKDNPVTIPREDPKQGNPSGKPKT